MFLKYRAKKKEYKKPLSALYFDFDEVMNRSSAPDLNGFIGGDIIAPTQFSELHAYCIKYHIPIYIITNRAKNDLNQQHVAKLIDQVGGFSSDHEIGGFKQKNICYLGIESRSKHGKSILIGVHKSKMKAIEAIHQAELPALARSEQLMIDDDVNNLDPISQAGYATRLAIENDDSHVQYALDFVKARVLASFARNDFMQADDDNQDIFKEKRCES